MFGENAGRNTHEMLTAKLSIGVALSTTVATSTTPKQIRR